MSALYLPAASGAGPTMTAQIITVIVAFLIVVWILKALAWKPILLMLDERRERIARSFDEIDRKTADAAALAKEYEERLRRIDDEARDRQNRAIDEGRRTATAIIEKARGEAEEIISKARANLDMEMEKARLQLRTEAVELSLAATGKLLAANMDDERQRQLAREFVEALENRKAS